MYTDEVVPCYTHGYMTIFVTSGKNWWYAAGGSMGKPLGIEPKASDLSCHIHVLVYMYTPSHIYIVDTNGLEALTVWSGGAVQEGGLSGETLRTDSLPPGQRGQMGRGGAAIPPASPVCSPLGSSCR